MPKQKSSASSATKKKHARKTAAREEQLAARAAAEELAELEEENGEENGDEEKPVKAEDAADEKNEPAAAIQPLPEPPAPPLLSRTGKKLKDSPPAHGPQRGQKDTQKQKKKQSKKHAKGQAPPPPRKKQYIPPPKPPKTNVDPVDIYGLGVVGAGYERVPADKVVSLRLLNKKDAMSVERGLDEMLAWINELQQDPLAEDADAEIALSQLSEAIPVWVHHLPRLLSHASRRVRYLTSSINAILLHQGSKALLGYTVPALITPINLEREEYLSCQLCATFDPDRQVRSLSTATWQALSQLISPKDYLAEILDSVTDSILESSGSTSSLEDKAKRKLSDEERIALQEEKDRKLNYLTANIEAFTWLLQYYTDENTALFARVSSSDSFWFFLSSKSMDSPQVRRAVWRTLNTLLAQEQTHSLVQDSLPTISEIAPKAAFSERDYQTQNTLWEPLISLFRLHPLIWKGAITGSDEDSTNESSSSSGSESENSSNPAASSRLSQNIAAFFDLLQVGFYGNALSGYSATPLLVHTIPARILPRTHDNLERLFTSLWGAYAGGAIDNASTATFVKCLIDLVRLSLVSEEAAGVSSSQIVRLWEYYLHLAPPPSKHLSLSNQSTIEEMEKALISLHAKYPQMFGTTWASIAEMSKQNINRDANAVPLAQALAQLSSSSSEHISLRAQALLQECVILAASKESSDNLNNFILEALQHSGKEILQVAELQQAVDKYMMTVGPEQHTLVMAYLRTRGVTEASLQVWDHICKMLASKIEGQGLSPLLPFLEAFHPSRSQPAELSNAQMDDAIISHSLENLSTDSSIPRALELLLHAPAPVASQDFPSTLLTRLADFLETQLSALCIDASYIVPQEKVSAALSLISLATPEQLYATAAHYPAFISLFQWAELAPQANLLSAEIAQKARDICGKMVKERGTWSLHDLYAMTASRLGELLLEKQCHISPVILSETFFKLCALPEANRANLMAAFLPQEQELARAATSVYQSPPDPRLAALDPALADPASEQATDNVLASEKMDTYRRAMLAWLAVLSENRRLGSHADWLLPHVILVREMSSDDIMLADPYHPGRQDLVALRAVSERVAIHLCSQMTEAAPETWQADAVKALKDSSTGQDAPTKQLAVLLKQITASNELSYASRVFTSCLAMLLHQSGATQSDREEWLGLARTLQSKNIHICLAILTALRHTLSESPRLQRYQGEVASSLAGVKPSKVIKDGLPGLQTLLALAAASSSDTDLLPPNRAIFFMQGLQKWKLFDNDSESDEAANEEPLDAACPLILRVCTHLISAIQDLAGSHWDFIFDMTEYAVESFSWDEPATYAGLSAACELLEEIRVRSSINKGFRKLVQSSLIRSVRSLAPVFLSAPNAKAITLSLLSTMSHILSQSDTFTSGDIPKLLLLYNRLSASSLPALIALTSRAISKEVEELTIASETRLRVDTSEDMLSPSIPTTVIEMLEKQSQTPPGTEGETVKSLILWLMICNFFQDTTTTLKATFTEQVRKTGFVGNALLPSIYSLTNVSDRSRGLDLAGWQVQDFQVLDFDDEDHAAASQLAAHVYYQTLKVIPSLVRSEWESIKNKQLSMSIEAFTSRAFSPLLIEAELARVHAEEAKGTLQDEEMSVKVLPNVNEVKAVYTVDEQPMEIGIRIPTNFPLSPVEVRDIKRIGVPEATWRAWLLNVQLIISGQNGSIADALALFKTNAARHFEGVEACAICYSVVSVTDRSMPTKRCRTCKQLSLQMVCDFAWIKLSSVQITLLIQEGL